MPRATIAAEGLPAPQRLAYQDHPNMPSFCASASLQSPPKLNEVSSDANRETIAAESGSESSSQEATPEKGRPRSCPILGEDHLTVKGYALGAGREGHSAA